MNYEGRPGKSSDLYGGVHVEKFLDWISQVENFFKCMEIP